MKLLEDILIIDFSQFLSGPSASLRLADLGAEVIKVERPDKGDICRELYVSDVRIEGDSTIFHAINRNKESYTADLKNPDDLARIKTLIERADVVMHNFRPGVMERIGLDYASVKKINPGIVYAEISGYGAEGPWAKLPGQDLLLQSVSGLTWLSNNAHEDPTPMGVAVVDILAGTHLAQGILAALFSRSISGEGSLVQVNMFESILDFQFEVLTCFYNDGGQLPERGSVNSAHAYIGAPYGIYKTADAYLSLAMTHIPTLGSLIGCEELLKFSDNKEWYKKRDEIKNILAHHLTKQTTNYWLDILEKSDIWCSPVWNYDELAKQEGYKKQQMELVVTTSTGIPVKTTRCPIRVDGEILVSTQAAPALGEHNTDIERRFGLIPPVVQAMQTG